MASSVVNNGTQHWYPNILGERASVKRKTPQPDWILYQCKIRGTSDSYEASRAKENLAGVQPDINSASESQTQHNMGKGHRNRRPRKQFAVDESHDSSSDASTVGMYGPTQFDTHLIPPELYENAVRTARQVANNVPMLLKALESHQSTSLFNVNSPSSTAGSSSVVRRETGERDQVFVAQPTNTEGFEKIVKKLVWETLKQNKTLTNLMDKLVRMIRSLGGASVSNCLQQALKSVFSIKVMAQANWEGKTKKESIQKHGLQHSIISTAGFAHNVYFSAANNIDCSAANTVDCSAANTIDCSAANTVDYSAANTTRITQGSSLLIYLFQWLAFDEYHLRQYLRTVLDKIKPPMDVHFQINWMFVFGRQLDVRFRTSNGRRSTERISGRSRIIRITSSSDVQIFISKGRATINGSKSLETRCRSVLKSDYFAAL
ncbi:hypothetical protein DAPPUDRAFT_103861 [Daphnia pulex]|uniref:DUF4806 domain-containing protein n=1 Tax=Daphnia pulex TaxID=6669 RepID=E9GKK3_DAPPU|nr:hypothetical protein DAPPUDRAFT_103861 [Daphnia pulex]|eukprot:EFX80049.1 hypothetical protein DAPPUDRAFT_103861 [Daphnia pulex]